MHTERRDALQFPARPSLTNNILWLAGVALVYFLAARLSLRLVFEPEGIAAVWPPAGIFVSALLLTRRELRGAMAGVLFLTDFVAEMLAGTPVLVSALYALALAGDAVLSVWLMRRFLGEPITFRRVREVAGWLLLSVVISNALMSLVAVAASELLPGHQTPLNSWKWWAASDGTGNLLVTPFVLTWAAWFRSLRARAEPPRLFEGAALGIVASLGSVALFDLMGTHALFTLFLPYLTFPFLLWAALRFGQRGVASVMFILAAIAIPFVAGGRVPGFSPTSSVLDEVIVMQLVLVCAAVPSLFLAAVVTERADSEAARLANERRHGVTLQSIGDAVITTDNHGMVELANPVAEALTGWRHVEARGKPLQDVFHIVNERTRQTVESPVERVLRDGRVVGLANHTLLVAKDGTERPIADSGAPIRDEDGTITGVVLVFRDQTEELAATEALRRSQALLESVTEGTTDCVFVKDRTGRYVLCNSAACQLAGKPREAILGSDDTALFPPDDARVLMELDQQVMASGKTTTTDEVLRMGAEPRTFLSTKGPICNAQGEVVGMFGISRDVTERRKAEEALRISEERYRAILHTAMDGFFLLDLQGRLLEVNETYCKMSGYSQAELLTMSVPDLSAAETAAQTKAHLERIVARGADRFESRHRRKDGTTYEVAASVQYSPIEGGRIVVFLQDISARKAAEREKEALEAQLRQSQRLESVGLLAGGIAHDFNNMLGVILGSAERAIEQAATAKPVAEELAEIRNAALHSAALTRQLLTFARRQAVSPKVMDLNETVPEMITMLQRLIGEDVLLLWRPAERLWPVKMDPSQLDQILTNLCLNARHAMASVGTILIATENRVIDAEFCSTHADVVPGEYVRLTVRDTGAGMDEATLRRIFEPFFTTKGVGKGTGLGLASVYGAVRQCGGFLTVDSVVGVGTTFEMYLPRDAAQKPSADHKSERTPVDLQGHETILLVEDEAALLRLTRRILESQGYTVIATGSPDEGIRLAREHGGEIDLLLSDVIMPEMNGYEMAATLRAARPRLTCLFMSGYSADTVTEHGMPADAPLIEKPFTPAALVAKVRAVLDAASA